MHLKRETYIHYAECGNDVIIMEMQNSIAYAVRERANLACLTLYPTNDTQMATNSS